MSSLPHEGQHLAGFESLLHLVKSWVQKEANDNVEGYEYGEEADNKYEVGGDDNDYGGEDDKEYEGGDDNEYEEDDDNKYEEDDDNE